MFSSILITLFLALGVCATPHIATHQKRHNNISKRHPTDVQLHKRVSNARWTFYDVGMGACGKFNVPSDFIVALNSQQFGGGYPGPNCFKSITMTYNGKSAQAMIMDECPGCPNGGLDLSRGLFQHFASEDAGVIYGTWTFNDVSGGGGNQPTPKPTTSDPPPKPKTTTHTQPSTKSEPSWTPKAEPTTTSSEKSSTTTTTSHSTTTSTTTTTTTTSSSKSIDYTSDGLAVPTGTLSSTPGSPQNLNNINYLLIQYGRFLVEASSVH